MAQDNDLFQSLLRHIYEILKPGITLISDPQARPELLESLGLPPNGGPAPAIPPGDGLVAYINKESSDADPFALASAIADLSLMVLAIESFIQGSIEAGGGNGEEGASDIMTGFLELLTLDYIRRRAPGFHSIIGILNVLDEQAVANGGSVNFVKDVIFGFFRRLGNGLKNFESEDDAKSVSDPIFLLLGGLLFGADLFLKKNNISTVEIKSGYGYEGYAGSTTPVMDGIANRGLSFSVEVNPVDAVKSTAYNTVLLIPKQHGGVALATELAGILKIDIPVTSDKKKKIKIDTSGNGFFRIGNGASADAVGDNHLTLAFEHNRDTAGKWSMLDKPTIKLGIGTYLIGLTVKPDDFEVKAKFDMLYTFGRGGLSGFPFDLLPDNKDGKEPLAFGYSIKRNFFFDGFGSVGSGGGGAGNSRDLVSSLINLVLNALNMRVPIHENIGGVLGFETIYIRMATGEEFKHLEMEVSVDFWLKMGGVITISISRIGMLLNMDKRADNGGVLGYDLKPGFKPPNGAGIRVNAGIVTGGGFLYIDEAKGEYFGSLELSVQGLFSLKAVGIINTIMPDGSKGFSMFILITAEFSAIQLGFGFTLLGVGGLLGLNRSMNVEALRVGLRTNAIKSILFPEDVVGNIHRIISDIKQVFPIQPDHFVIGLMGKIGWGTPTLLSIELGVLIELPDPKIVLIGVIKCVMPAEEAALIKVQVNFLGVLDFQNQFLYFEARLFDSHLVGITLTGSMAFTVAWGSQSVFAISIGGFHPDFKDYPSVPTLPGAFRDMDRLGIQLFSGDNPRLGVECYLAVTSNTVQFGAKLELYAGGPMGFNLYGKLAFDALFIFDPFSFVISLEAMLAIRQGESILFGIRYYGKLSGPTPWHVEGEVTFGLLFFDVTIGFSVTWGDDPTTLVEELENLTQLLQTELQDNRNWRPIVPDYHHLHVNVRELPEDETPAFLMHPFGEIVFSQRKMPLNYKIQKYGSKKPEGADLFRISKVSVNNVPLGVVVEKEMFAPGNYTPLSEQEKLSRKSYEKMDSGVRITDAGKLSTAPPNIAPVTLDYELDYTYDDSPPLKSAHVMSAHHFDHLKQQAGVSKSPLAWQQSAQVSLNRPADTKLLDVPFVLASTDTMAVFGADFQAASYAEAVQMHADLLRKQPELKGKIQILEGFELVH